MTIQTSVKASTHSLEVGGLICHYHGSQPGSKHIHCQPAAQKCRHGVEQRPKDSSNDDRSRAVCCNISGAFATPLACAMLLCSLILWLLFHTFPIRAVILCPGDTKKTVTPAPFEAGYHCPHFSSWPMTGSTAWLCIVSVLHIC